jgi:hypothetical protein
MTTLPNSARGITVPGTNSGSFKTPEHAETGPEVRESLAQAEFSRYRAMTERGQIVQALDEVERLANDEDPADGLSLADTHAETVAYIGAMLDEFDEVEDAELLAERLEALLVNDRYWVEEGAPSDGTAVLPAIADKETTAPADQPSNVIALRPHIASHSASSNDTFRNRRLHEVKNLLRGLLSDVRTGGKADLEEAARGVGIEVQNPVERSWYGTDFRPSAQRAANSDLQADQPAVEAPKIERVTSLSAPIDEVGLPLDVTVETQRREPHPEREPHDDFAWLFE